MSTYLVKKLPKSLQERVEDIEFGEAGLTDDCRYMVVLNVGWEFTDGGMTWPCLNFREVKRVVRHNASFVGLEGHRYA